MLCYFYTQLAVIANIHISDSDLQIFLSSRLSQLVIGKTVRSSDWDYRLTTDLTTNIPDI